MPTAKTAEVHSARTGKEAVPTTAPVVALTNNDCVRDYRKKKRTGWIKGDGGINPVPPPETTSAADANIPETFDDTAGTLTDDLSDLSEDTYYRLSRRHHSLRFTNWWAKRISPLMRDRGVVAMATVNFGMAILIVLTFIVFAVCVVWYIVIDIQLTSEMTGEGGGTPCYFEFTEWSNCSATCRDFNEPVPFKTRMVDDVTYMHPFGTKYPKCPPRFKPGTTMSAVCNVQWCPLNLTDFDEWSQCFPKNPGNESSTCYQVRILPATNQLIRVRLGDFLVKECQCPDNRGSTANKTEGLLRANVTNMTEHI